MPYLAPAQEFEICWFAASLGIDRYSLHVSASTETSRFFISFPLPRYLPLTFLLFLVSRRNCCSRFSDVPLLPPSLLPLCPSSFSFSFSLVPIYTRTFINLALLFKVNIMMLEADVTLGIVNGTSNNSTPIPIMAHPPASESNLSLDDFLNTVIKRNVTKGIKLDFKSIDAFNASKPILEKVRNNTKFPVFLNADILPGPVNANTTTAVDAKAFVSQAMTFPEYTLSVGWTTRYGIKDNVTEGQYTEQQIQDMINILKEQKVTQPITYPVRAGLAANSTKVIKSLMENSSFASDVTLTVWSSEGDKVDAESLSTLIRDIGVKKVYVDVPQDLMNKLYLSAASSVMVASVTLAVSLLTGLLSTIL